MTVLQKSLLGSFCFAIVTNVSSARLNPEVRAQVPQAPTIERPQTSNIQAPGEVLTKVELYFGLSRPDGTTVSVTEWQSFVNREITPRFRDGITVMGAYGQYQLNSGRIVQENTKVVILIYKNSVQKEMNVQAIIDAYKQAFQQESVLRTTNLVKVAF